MPINHYKGIIKKFDQVIVSVGICNRKERPMSANYEAPINGEVSRPVTPPHAGSHTLNPVCPGAPKRPRRATANV